MLKNSAQWKSFSKFCEKHDFSVMVLAVDNQQPKDVLCAGNLSVEKATSIIATMTPTKNQEVLRDLPALPTNYPELFKNQQQTIVLANTILKMYIGETPIGEGINNYFMFTGSERSLRSNNQHLAKLS